MKDITGGEGGPGGIGEAGEGKKEKASATPALFRLNPWQSRNWVSRPQPAARSVSQVPSRPPHPFLCFGHLLPPTVETTKLSKLGALNLMSEREGEGEIATIQNNGNFEEGRA